MAAAPCEFVDLPAIDFSLLPWKSVGDAHHHNYDRASQTERGMPRIGLLPCYQPWSGVDSTLVQTVDSITSKKSLTVNVQIFSTMYSCSQQCTALLTELKLTTPTRTGLLQHGCYCYRHFQDCVAASCYNQQHLMRLNSLSVISHSSRTTCAQLTIFH